MEQSPDHKDMLEVMKQNTELLRENNTLLKQMHRQSVIGLWLKIGWFAIIVGLPFAVYFYFLEPYFEAFGANYEVFIQGIAEIPGLKGIESLLPNP